MKKFSLALAALAALMLGATGFAEARDRGAGHGAKQHRPAQIQHRAGQRGFERRVDGRQMRQRARIREGVASGSLNRHQAARLRKDQRRVRAMERRFAVDGRFDRRERRVLDHALDRSSKRIWRMKGKHYGEHRGHRPGFRPRDGWRGKGHYRGHGRHFRRHHHRRHHHRRHVEYVYPVYDDTPAHSLGVDIETKDFRFSVNKSG